jgi:ribonucleoside-diphosphate reductase alpha chain
MLDTRLRTGEPYFFFVDRANRSLPEAQKNIGLRINGSNLCSEIMLATNEERTAVCCLSSLNVEKIDEWLNTGLVEDITTALDNVISFFIDNAQKYLHRAIYSAMRERSIGIGIMGWHALLQQRHMAFDSDNAVNYGELITEIIMSRAKRQSRLLAKLRGEPPDLIGTGMRNTHLMAIAPNANSATLAATSPGIEIAQGNAYVHRTRVGSHLVKNRYLEEVLENYNKNDTNTWQSIILAGGSVRHLDFLTDHERAVFRTAMEIDQAWIIKHAAARQKIIDQGQSVNLFLPPNTDKAELVRLHIMAWQMGLKALYYCRSESSVAVDAVGVKVKYNKLVDVSETAARAQIMVPQLDDCVACQG